MYSEQRKVINVSHLSLRLKIMVRACITAGLVLISSSPNASLAQDHVVKRTFAQALVDEVAEKHKPGLLYLGIHAQPPESTKSVIYAATDPSKIGKESSCGDLDVVTKGVPILEMKGKTSTVLERLLDSSGQTIGLIAVGLNFPEGQETQAAKLAKQIGEELAQKIPSKSALFEAAK
jgi:hypothetical protein